MRKRVLLCAIGLLVALGLGFTFLGGSSAAQDAGPTLVIYTGENFTGEAFRVTETMLDMPPGVDEGPEEFRWEWNDNVKSIEVVSGTWRLYQNGRLNTKLDLEDPREVTVDFARAKGRDEGWICLVSANSRGAVRYATPTSGPWAHDISSIELVSEENLPDWATR